VEGGGKRRQPRFVPQFGEQKEIFIEKGKSPLFRKKGRGGARGKKKGYIAAKRLVKTQYPAPKPESAEGGSWKKRSGDVSQEKSVGQITSTDRSKTRR